MLSPPTYAETVFSCRSKNVAPGHIFSEYAYFLAYSGASVDHERHYAKMMTERLGIGPASPVIEFGCSDGYLLHFFVERGICVLSIHRAANVAGSAEQRGILMWVKFFGVETARDLAQREVRGDLVIATMFLRRLPTPNPQPFVEGIRIILNPNGCDDGVPASSPNDRRRPVRSDLSRAFLVLSALAAIAETRHDYELILPCYVKDEITAQLAYIRY
jgi:hypothetical protein